MSGKPGRDHYEEERGRQRRENAQSVTVYVIEDQHGNVVARPKDLAEATRLYCVGFNSFRLVAIEPCGKRRVIAEKGLSQSP
jgi:hypothetical protein